MEPVLSSKHYTEHLTRLSSLVLILHLGPALRVPALFSVSS